MSSADPCLYLCSFISEHIGLIRMLFDFLEEISICSGWAMYGPMDLNASSFPERFYAGCCRDSIDSLHFLVGSAKSCHSIFICFHHQSSNLPCFNWPVAPLSSSSKGCVQIITD